MLREGAFWDIYYEHCSYFSLGSLARLFRSCGFEILNLGKAFDDQYLVIETRPSNGSVGRSFESERDLEELAREIKQFEVEYPNTLERWKKELEQIKDRGQRAVIWGSSSKSVAYLTTLDVSNEIGYVVDINPNKQGMFMAGTGHEIVPPNFLKQYYPDVIIVMNPIYRDEIKRDLKEMDVSADLITL